MGFVLESTAPRAYGASTLTADLVDWGPQPDALEGTASHSTGRLLHKGPDAGEGARPEVGLWRCTPGRWRLAFPAHEVFYVTAGEATYFSDSGERIEATPGTLIHFRTGWAGVCEVREPLFATYMLSEGAPGSGPTPILRDAPSRPPEAEWGVIDTMIDGQSKVDGILLHRDGDGRAESGLWVCSPGTWRCHVTSDEYCHFIAGRATYTHQTGEVIEIEPDTAAFFAKDWKGVCQVHQTIRKVYMIR